MTPLAQRLRELVPRKYNDTGADWNAAWNACVDRMIKHIDDFEVEAVLVHGCKPPGEEFFTWCEQPVIKDTHRAYLICIEEIPKERPKVSKREIIEQLRSWTDKSILCIDLDALADRLEAGEVVE